MCSCVCKILADVELNGLLHLVTLFLEEFDYTARVQYVLHTTGCVRVFKTPHQRSIFSVPDKSFFKL